MNTGLNLNISLYIKRAEEHHTESYIREAFEYGNRYGKVREIKFIPKKNEQGKPYNGVVITFEKWFYNPEVQGLFKELQISSTRTAKIIHNKHTQRYWLVSEHKEKEKEKENVEYEVAELTTVDKTLSDTNRIEQLENLIRTMSMQMSVMQTRQEKNETTLMECEQHRTQDLLNNMDLQAQIVDKKIEKNCLERLLGFKKDENERLKKTISYLEYAFKKKEEECEELREELRSETCIRSYMETQVDEMRQMLNLSD